MSDRRRIPEEPVKGKPLGRHVNHDPRSRAYAFTAGEIVSASHARHVPIFDQGSLGSCTGMAAVGCVETTPHAIGHETHFGETTAVSVYADATRIDPWPGEYPPDDTGSDGLSVAKVCKARGWISGYQHAFSLDAALTALQTYPVITGFNWYDSFDEPDAFGIVRITPGAEVRGGHEVEVLSVDATSRLVTAANSWGQGWGVGGYFSFTWDDWERLLSEDGDVTVLIPANEPAPTPDPDRPAGCWPFAKTLRRLTGGR